MQTESELRTDSNMYNSGTRQLQLIHEELNAVLNFAKLDALLKSGRARDIADESVHTDEACFIIGSGASLDDALPLLHNWKGGIVCTTSHALTLVKHNAPPTHIFALDPFCTQEEIEGIDWSKYKTKLITVPTVWPSLIDYWPNEILLYRQNQGQPQGFYASVLNHMFCTRAQITEEEATAICLRDNIPREHFNMPRAYKFVPRIRTEVTLFACSPPAQLFVAHLMGYRNIFLSGCDFAYTKNKDRFTNWTINDDIWTEHDNPLNEASINVMTTNGIPSNQVHVYYKKNTLSGIRLLINDDPSVQIITTDHGAITELPYVDIEHVIEKQGRHIKHTNNADVSKDIEIYLASVGAHCIFANVGNKRDAMVFIEANKIDDVFKHMTNMNLAYKCTACGSDLMAPQDGQDHTGKNCPRCGKPTLKAKAKVNIDENMFRLRSNIVQAERLVHASD